MLQRSMLDDELLISKDENGRKRNYNVENESGRYGIFLYFSN